jgi:hypothetical protein
MTDLQLYLLVAPFVLLAAAWLAVYWVIRNDRQHRAD